jgi:hypothetical protein
MLDEIEETARWWARTAVQSRFRKTRRGSAVELRVDIS